MQIQRGLLTLFDLCKPPGYRVRSNLAYCFIRRRGKVQGMGRSVRGVGSCEGTEKSEDGDKRRIRSALYTVLILKSHDYLLVFIWLSTLPYSFLIGLPDAAQLCRSILERSSVRVKG